MGIITTSGYDRANYADDSSDAGGELANGVWSVQFSVDWGASEQQRDLCNEDIRFCMVEGGQWEGYLSDSFSSNRPKMEMDKTYERVNTFMSQYAESKPSVVFGPASGSNTSTDECKILNGLFRADMRRNNGYYGVYNAVHEAVLGGAGAFRLRTEWEDPEDDQNLNQNICFEPIHQAYSSVIWDSNAKRYDKRDAKYCNVITWLTTSAFEERYPGKAPASVPVDNQNRSMFDWNTPDGVYVAERFWLEEEIKTSILLRHPDTEETVVLFEEEFKYTIAELDEAGFEEVSRRKKLVKCVKKCVYSGIEKLEDTTEVAGKFIPIVPVYAFWIYADNGEKYLGLIRKQKDPQRLFNTQTSSLAELASTSIKQAPIFAPEQMIGPGIKEQWSQAHLGNTNYLLVEPLRDDSGQIISAGPIGTVTPPQVNPALAAILQLSSDFLQANGDMIPTEIPNREVSGDAIGKLIKRVDLKTYLIMENIFNSLILAGDVYREMATAVYVNSRQATLLEEDDTQSTIQLNGIRIDPNTGDAVAENQIAGRRFECYAKVGPAFHTQREEVKATMLNLLEKVGQESPYYNVLLAEFINLLDGSTEALTKFNRDQMLKLGLRKPATPEEEQQLKQQQEAAQKPTPEEQLVLAATKNEESQAAENAADVTLKGSQTELNKAKSAEALASADEKSAGAWERANNVLQFESQQRTGA